MTKSTTQHTSSRGFEYRVRHGGGGLWIIQIKVGSKWTRDFGLAYTSREATEQAMRDR